MLIDNRYSIHLKRFIGEIWRSEVSSCVVSL
jgi:hypothetical protein